MNVIQFPPPPPEPFPAEPPNNIEVEQALLGSIFVNNDAYWVIAGMVEPAHFFEPVHRKIFESAASLIKNGKVATPVTLKGCIPDSEKIGDLTPSQYLARLASEAITVINAPDYARIIRDLADRRSLTEIATEIATSADNAAMHLSPRDLATDAIGKLDSLLDRRHDRASMRAVDVREALVSAMDQISHAYQREGQISGVTWGLKDLDAATLGLHRGEVCVLAGRPSMGKTALALSAARSATEAGHGVAFFSLEMGADALGMRMLADSIFGHDKPISYFRMRKGDITEQEFTRIAHEAQRLQELPLIIEQEPSLSIGQISARVRRARQRLARANQSLDLVIVDYLQLVRPDDRYRGNKVAETTELSAGIKRIAKEEGVSMLALSQLSRQVESREDKRPQLSDLRESGAIEQDADTVIGLYREEYYLERAAPKEGTEAWFKWEAALIAAKNRLDAIILKQRHGPISTIKTRFYAGSNAVRDVGAA